MQFQSPGEVLLSLGPVTVRWYGFLTALAFLACLSAAYKIAKSRKLGIEEEEVSNFAIITIVGGLIGARLWFVLLNLSYFLDNPMQVFQIWLGGQSIQGGLLGAAVALFLYELYKKPKNLWQSYLNKLSLAAIVTPLGQAIGRWGNFFNEEAFGSVTDLPWKLYISHTQQFHHPTFLYESIWNLLVFLILLQVSKFFKPAQVIAAFLFLYSIARIVLEHLRTDSLYIGDFKAATLISIITIVISALVFVCSAKNKS